MHIYRQSFYMGNTHMSGSEFHKFIGDEKLAKRWHSSTYKLMNRNCLDFAIWLCDKLEVAYVPQFVYNLPHIL